MMLNKWCLICCFLKWHQTVWIRPFLLINCSMNNDVQVQLLIANWTEASGNTQYHIKRIHRLYYTEHSRKTFGNQLVMFLACMHVQMNILNSVPAVHITYLTVLPYGRYYSLKNAMAPRVSSEHITNTNIYQSSVINSSGMLIYQKCTSETY